MHFLPVLELMFDSLTTIQVEPHQCPSHQSILHIQGPIPEILRIGEALKMTFVQVFVFQFFVIGLFKNFLLLKKTKEVHMRYVVFISVLWIEKGCILTNICTRLYLGMKNLSKGHISLNHLLLRLISTLLKLEIFNPSKV